MARFMAIKAMGDGQLANSKGTLYTTPSSTQAIIRLITLVNTGSGTNSVNLYLNLDASNSRRIISKDTQMLTGESLHVEGPFTLEAADLLEGDATNATEVDFTINGAEETAV